MTGLRPHQENPYRRLAEILRVHQSAVDFSGTGTGKTYVAAAVMASLKLPTLVVAPKIAGSAWARAAEHFGEKFSVIGYEKLRTGQTPFGKWRNPDPRPKKFLQCIYCRCIFDPEKPTPCFAHPTGIHCVEQKSKSANYGAFTFHPAVKAVVFDEGHRCSGVDSLNSDMLLAAKRQGLKTLFLSATAACNPIKMRGLGYLLDLHNLDTDIIQPAPIGSRIIRPSFSRWASKFGVQRDARFRGLKWLVGEERQLETMAEIRDLIIPARGVRVRSEDIPGFPACDIQAELYDLDDPEAVDSAYKEMAEALDQLRQSAEADKAPEHPLTKILRARQKVELLKVPIAAELGQDYIDKGHSMVFFVNFRQTIDELAKRFPAARIIDGSPDSIRHRDESVELFQANRINSLIVNNEAGGVALSLHDLHGDHPRGGLVFPNFSAESMRQVFGRLPRDGGKTPVFYRVMFANKTIEMPVHKALRSKLGNLDALNDRDLSPNNLSFPEN